MSGQSQQTVIRIRKATRADIDDVVRIQADAFAPGIMNRLMYPNGMSEEARSKYGASSLKIVEESEARDAGTFSGPEDPESFLFVAEATPTDEQSRPEIIAFAHWEVYRKPRTEEEWNVREPASTYTTEGVNTEVMVAFIGGIREMRRQNMRGDPSICCRMLCTAPGRSRLGAGSALLRWGAELADRERLPIWLEATATGYPLYRRFGFEVVDTLDLNVSERWGATRRADEDWGANAGVALFGTAPEGVVRTVGMRRPPDASS